MRVTRDSRIPSTPSESAATPREPSGFRLREIRLTPTKKGPVRRVFRLVLPALHPRALALVTSRVAPRERDFPRLEKETSGTRACGRWYKDVRFRARAVRAPRALLAEFGTQLGPATAVRVHDSTADCRYLVLPERPASSLRVRLALLSLIHTFAPAHTHTPIPKKIERNSLQPRRDQTSSGGHRRLERGATRGSRHARTRKQRPFSSAEEDKRAHPSLEQVVSNSPRASAPDAGFHDRRLPRAPACHGLTPANSSSKARQGRRAASRRFPNRPGPCRD